MCVLCPPPPAPRCESSFHLCPPLARAVHADSLHPSVFNVLHSRAQRLTTFSPGTQVSLWVLGIWPSSPELLALLRSALHPRQRSPHHSSTTPLFSHAHSSRAGCWDKVPPLCSPEGKRLYPQPPEPSCPGTRSQPSSAVTGPFQPIPSTLTVAELDFPARTWLLPPPRALSQGRLPCPGLSVPAGSARFPPPLPPAHFFV